MSLDLFLQTSYPYPQFDPNQNPGPRAALRVNNVLDVVMQSDVIPALVGLDVEGHLYHKGESGQVSICPEATTYKAHASTMAQRREHGKGGHH